MKKLSIVQVYTRDCNAKCDFANPKFSVETTLVINRDLQDAIYEGLRGHRAHGPVGDRIATLEALKFVVPIAGVTDGRGDVDEDSRRVLQGGAKPDAWKASSAHSDAARSSKMAS
eukprot:9502042-Pyramimonas_sp.AAC.1